jgi:hypothetical protein
MADAPLWVERSVRIYRTLLRAYPAVFRKQYEEEMTLVFRELTTNAWQHRGPFGVLLMWLYVIGDLVWSASKEHFLETEGSVQMADSEKAVAILTGLPSGNPMLVQWSRFTLGVALALLIGMFAIAIPLATHISNEFLSQYRCEAPKLAVFLAHHSPWLPLSITICGGVALLAKERWCKNTTALRLNVVAVVATVCAGCLCLVAVCLPVLQLLANLQRVL